MRVAESSGQATGRGANVTGSSRPNTGQLLTDCPDSRRCSTDPELTAFWVWDAYLEVPNPDALAAEFASRGVPLSVPVRDRDDGLRGFELADIPDLPARSVHTINAVG